jgi:hypothetical protein
MSKRKKITLFLMGLGACLSALVMPVFLQWYQQQTGIYPVGFVLVYAIATFAAIMSVAMSDLENI